MVLFFFASDNLAGLGKPCNCGVQQLGKTLASINFKRTHW
jgi:hypothetical protein